jgi:hypothetical protein
MVLAVHMRRSAPPNILRPPKKSPDPGIATMASRPAFECAESFTRPLWIYPTLSHGSPWLKMTAVRRYSTIFLAIPAESKNTWALDATFWLRFHRHSPGRPLDRRFCRGHRLDGELDQGLAATAGLRALVIRLVTINCGWFSFPLTAGPDAGKSVPNLKWVIRVLLHKVERRTLVLFFWHMISARAMPFRRMQRRCGCNLFSNSKLRALRT